ncbi:MAG: HAD-IIB family hydrolase [Bryobacterales bacterium]|nr:HAD-IIB family hydrolase [Bryobacterales bacterium]
MQHLVFSDMDGTILDHDTYSFEPARPALARLREVQIPVIFTTSKTRAETEYWRHAMDCPHPFIVENGGAAFIPSNHGYRIIEWGTPYSALVAALQRAAQASGCPVRGFASMTVAQVAEACALPLDMAAMAARREYDEPFQVLDPSRTPALAAAIAAEGLRTTQGGRFWHITGANDKGLAVQALQRHYPSPVRSIGLGDGLNDVPLLLACDIAVIIRSPQSDAIQQRVPHGAVTQHPGPAGWNEAILSLFGNRPL